MLREVASCLLIGFCFLASSYCPMSSSSTYAFLELIGDGDEGLIYLAIDADQNKVAIKCHRHLNEAQKEFGIGLGLPHPHIVKVYEWFVEQSKEGEHSYLVMELVHGKTLRETPPKTLSQRQALENAHSLVDALNYAAQKHWVHADLTTSNLMFDAQQNIKIIDLAGFVPKTDDNFNLKYVHNIIAMVIEILIRADFNHDEIFTFRQSLNACTAESPQESLEAIQVILLKALEGNQGISVC